MGKVDGLIIPRSYNDYFSRSDPQAIRDLVVASTDDALSSTSENPVQNKVVTGALNEKARKKNVILSTANLIAKISTAYTDDRRVTLLICVNGSRGSMKSCYLFETYGNWSNVQSTLVKIMGMDIDFYYSARTLYLQYQTSSAQSFNVDVLELSNADISLETLSELPSEVNNLRYNNVGIDKLPNPPSTNGSYTLQCDVSSGVTAYSWRGGGLVFYKDFENIDCSYSAGVIGTRGQQQSFDPSISGYSIISADIFYIQYSDRGNIMLFWGNGYTNLFVNTYRTSANAQTNKCTIRVYYVKSALESIPINRTPETKGGEDNGNEEQPTEELKI